MEVLKYIYRKYSDVVRNETEDEEEDDEEEEITKKIKNKNVDKVVMDFLKVITKLMKR